MQIKRIIIGLLIGAAIGAALEYANMLLTFLLPPFFVLLPLTILVGAVLGAATKNATHSPLTDQVQGLGHLPICAAEFIRLIVKKMRYSRKVRQDVQAELTAHFDDELRNCTTDEDKEKKAQRLIADFGDVKLLAILLRRAKKRCRPLWRTITARTFQTVGVLILCLAVYVVWFLTGKPVITTNYVAELNRITKPVVDESLNAAPLYNKAAELYEKLPEDISTLLGTQYIEATDEEKQLIEKWITNNEEIYNIVIAGTKKPYYWSNYGEGEDIEDMMGILMPHLAGFRKLFFALRCRALLRVEQGKYKDAFDDLLACYRFGQHLRGDKTLVEQLVGIAIEAKAVKTIWDILSQYQIDSSTLAKLQQDFEQMIAGEDFVVSLKAEKLLAYDVIQRTFTGGLGGGHIIPKRVWQLYPEVEIIGSASARDFRPSPGKTQKLDWFSKFILNIRYEICEIGGFIYETFRLCKKAGYILFLHPDKQQTLQATDGLYDYWEKLKGKTPAQIRAEAIDVEKETMGIVKGNILLEESAPAVSRVSAHGYATKGSVEAVLTIVAILRYKMEQGSYPDSLEELKTAGYLKELPTDPYNDKPLVYKKTDDNFMLYGVGENFKDDGGTVAVVNGRPRKWGTKDQGDWVIWPVIKPQVNK